MTKDLPDDLLPSLASTPHRSGSWLLLKAKLVLLVVILLTSNHGRAHTAQVSSSPCPQLQITGPERFVPTQAEATLLCGSEEQTAWRTAPLAQTAYFIRIFLQQRGYHQPEINREDQMVTVVMGTAAIIHTIDLKGAPETLDIRRYWPIFGEQMTPSALDQLEGWILRELAQLGFPCARLTTTADPQRHVVTVSIEDRGRRAFPKIESEGISGLQFGLERRYDAFTPGQPFDVRLLELTSRRLISEDLVIGAQLHHQCPDDPAEPLSLRQRFTEGEPRLITIGLGLDSEEYFVAEATWRHTRLGSMASDLLMVARGSYRQQTVEAVHKWYYAPVVTRHYLRSSVKLQHDNEMTYQSHLASITSGPAWQWDRRYGHHEFWLASTYRHIGVIRGDGPKTSRALAMTTAFDLQSHDYQFYRQAPRSGYRLALRTAHFRRDLAASYSADEISLDSGLLVNLREYDPEIWILGFRLSLATVLLRNGTTAADIPSASRLRLGGRDSLRGFARQRLPKQGALTTLYLGSELRLNSILPGGLQPIALLDYGRYSSDGYRFHDLHLWSPGVGVHWQSMFGTFRGTLAYGKSTGQHAKSLEHLNQWVFHFSYGEQF